MKRTKDGIDVLFDKDELKIIEYIHHSVSRDFESISNAISAFRRDETQSLSQLIKDLGTDRVLAASMKASAIDQASGLQPPPLDVIEGVLIELAVIHHVNYVLECQAMADAVRPGRRKGQKAPSNDGRRTGRQPAHGVTNDDLLARSKNLEPAERKAAFKAYALDVLRREGTHHPSKSKIENLVRSWERRVQRKGDPD